MTDSEHYARLERPYAVGRVMHESGRRFLGESDLLDGAGTLLGHGSGVFNRSSIPLDPSIGYR
jgi:hypothetical protein